MHYGPLKVGHWGSTESMHKDSLKTFGFKEILSFHSHLTLGTMVKLLSLIHRISSFFVFLLPVPLCVPVWTFYQHYYLVLTYYCTNEETEVQREQMPYQRVSNTVSDGVKRRILFLENLTVHGAFSESVSEQKEVSTIHISIY